MRRSTFLTALACIALLALAAVAVPWVAPVPGVAGDGVVVTVEPSRTGPATDLPAPRPSPRLELVATLLFRGPPVRAFVRSERNTDRDRRRGWDDATGWPTC